MPVGSGVSAPLLGNASRVLIQSQANRFRMTDVLRFDLLGANEHMGTTLAASDGPLRNGASHWVNAKAENARKRARVEERDMAESKSGTRRRSSSGGSKRSSGSRKSSSNGSSGGSKRGSGTLQDEDEMEARENASSDLEQNDEDSDSGGGGGGGGSKEQESETGGKDMGRPPADEPDVFVDIPEVRVGELNIDVKKLEAHLALRAEVANLVNLVAGVHVGIDEVKIDLKDVEAQCMLKVRLENTYNILDRTLTTLDENPEIVQGLLETADSAVQETGGGLGDTLSSVGDGLSGTLSGLGDGISSMARKASPKKLLPSGNGGGGGGGASKASSNGAGKTALKVGLAGAVGFIGAVAASEASSGRLSRSPLRKALDKAKP